MPGKPNNLVQFWQELKRRRVIHVITVYATAAFVIIELVNNLSEPLNLPARLSTIVIIILAVVFLLSIILSWLYDLTSEGVEKTKPLNEIKEGEKPVVPSAWKIATYVSFAVIIGLVTLNVMGVSKRLSAGDIQSLVIIPFENRTGDEQLDRFIEGMHASLIQDMGRISGFDVLNRTSSSVYKNVDMSMQEIASELDRDALIKPVVLCLGDDSVCLKIEVIRAFPKEKIIWIAEYKESKSQILNLNNRVTKQIADEVKIELTKDEELLLAESRTVDPEALEAYFNGLHHFERVRKEDLEKAKEYFEFAIEKEPDWADPYACLSAAWSALGFFGFIPKNVAIPQ